jgi:hypothetical protein
LLHDGRYVVTDLCDLDDDNGLARYYTFSWLETCRTTLDLLRETLNLDDVVSEDEITQTTGSRAIKLTHPFVVVEDINRLICIIMLCYFLS